MNQANQFLGNNVMNPQPQQRWMAKPAGDPSGLAYLKPLESLFVNQVVVMSERMIFELVNHLVDDVFFYLVVTGIAAQAKYGVFNDQREQIYFAFEESDVCQRMCCPKTRRFDLHIVDSANQEIIRIKREFRCFAGCNWFACCEACSQEVVVESPPGTIIGYVSQECSFLRATYVLKNESGIPVLNIVGPACICDGPYACCCENKFTIYGTDGSTEIGAVHKKYRGFVAESLTSADAFTIRIPLDLDVRMKAVALGALFLIDFAHFSLPPNRNKNRQRRRRRR
ncbi:unnamed protein product [Rotaria sordida]|uniref:Phospholipid scramblase n=2 Tax=Rotaria sordida TaxID=392033 RepID=A0A819JYZ5_9BILA|nr:unnamed protein product [Rotaria sordida]CAF1101306.1 unnamed protein product [Rotaria sordida]CAF3940312.1 unnamed protein product [Rotaria sordida]